MSPKRYLPRSTRHVVVVAEDLCHHRGEFGHGDGHVAAHVEHLVIGPIVFEHAQVGVDHVEVVHEVADLVAILVDHRIATQMERQGKDPASTRIGVIETLTRTLHDRIAHRDRGDGIHPPEIERRVLLRDLRGAVAVLRVGDGLIGGLGAQRPGFAGAWLDIPDAALQIRVPA